MKINPLVVFVLLISSTLASLGQSEFVLAPCFGDGMVLQRSSNTLLHGFGPKGMLLSLELRNEEKSRWNGPAWSGVTKVDGQGGWQLTVDLTTEKFQPADARWLLQVFEKKNKKHYQEYTNIHIGDVIIVAGWEGQGISAGIDEFVSGTGGRLFEHHKDEVRFLDLTLAGDFSGLEEIQEAKWEKWPADKLALDQYSTLTLRLAHELAEKKLSDLSTNKFIGIVLTRREVIENGLNPDCQDRPKALAASDEYLWQWITQDAQSAQTKRSTTLVHNKRHNVVTNLPAISSYDSALVGSRAAFSPEKPPLRCFTFAGAIWSLPQKETTSR